MVERIIVQGEIEALGCDLSHFKLLRLAAERDLAEDEGANLTNRLVRRGLLERAWNRWHITELGRAALSSVRAKSLLGGTDGENAQPTTERGKKLSRWEGL